MYFERWGKAHIEGKLLSPIDANFLFTYTTNSTVEGSFQYAEEEDGETALKEKIMQLFDVVSSTLGDAKITFRLCNARGEG